LTKNKSFNNIANIEKSWEEIMKNNNPSYIGITGFTRKEQIRRLLMEIIPGHTHKLMVGVLVNNITMRGIHIRSRYANTNSIPEIFLKDNRVLNIIHFNTYEKEKLLEHLTQLIYIAGENLHGFQLNMKWPDLNLLSEFKKRFPNKKIVVQMERDDFENYTPQQMSKKLIEYDYLADYVILDMSMGSGTEMHAQKLIEYGEEISKKTSLKIVFAGGLHAKNLHIIKPIIRLFPDACIDAEGKLMNESDSLDPQKTISYLHKALSMFFKK